ncbi:putative FMN-dependent luciferase-like monooxygenase [Microbacterium sp. NC79]|uniref:putative FMN-dependent luciferase-like monooxygenase n=1 Tax=Microbacterium sp. NC79 TaxID=2851009 RepID=UPI001C2B86F9|nr:putative FMN-dependent luciferase-like monooxygenase [Microbacterium sp. NC79]MBV0894482.1 putative FMN-dependent luciferase-like monooxygenase [Microbacterium sp. NC79]
MTAPTLAFFTRLLDDAPPAERYRLATEQIQHAERFGVGRVWVAQHHFRAAEGGLPSPFVFLTHAGAHTSTIRLATGIITLPLEDAVKVAEDSAVADLLTGGRIDLGMGSGGTPSSFLPFGQDPANKAAVFDDKLALLRGAYRGNELPGANHLYPAAPHLDERIWQATFSAFGGARAGAAGDGLLLSRTQPRPVDAPTASLADIQVPIIEQYRGALPDDTAPRITASRTVFVADSREEALRFAEIGLTRAVAGFRRQGQAIVGDTLEDYIRGTDTHIGTPEQVAESLAADATLAHATEIAFQVHSVDAPHEHILRSIELFATEVAPQLGWARTEPALAGAGQEIS